MTEEQLKDLTFYKAVATAFANEPSISQKIKDTVIMQTIQQINQDARPVDLTDTEVGAALTGETSRGRAVKLEAFRLFLVEKKDDGDELLGLYEKLDGNHSKNSDAEEKLYKLIHWAIAKAEGVYLVNENAPLSFDSEQILLFLRKLSRSKKVKISTTLVPDTYYADDEDPEALWVNIQQTGVFATMTSFEKFLKTLKTQIAVSSVHTNDGGVSIQYEPLPPIETQD